MIVLMKQEEHPYKNNSYAWFAYTRLTNIPEQDKPTSEELQSHVHLDDINIDPRAPEEMNDVTTRHDLRRWYVGEVVPQLIE